METDICIIGAGAAGITLAREFSGKSFRVCLLESGGFEADVATQQLCQGMSTGHQYSMMSTRLRYFGGTTNHWRGYCRPLDPEDFKARAWIPHSGWPISRTDLDPYYVRANRLVQLGEMRYEYDSWKSAGPLLPFDPARVRTQVVRFSPPTRFGQLYRGDVLNAPNIRTSVFANVTEIVPAGASSRIERVKIATLSGRRFSLKARIFILATGGIENPRLLLASRSVRPRGLGNEHDRVGRFFMDHPHVMPAYFLPMNPGLDTSFYLAHVHPGRQFTGTLTLAPAVLEKHGMASVSFTLEPSLRVGSRGPAEEDERLLNKGLPEPPRSWRELAAELSGFARPLSRVLVDLRMGGAMARARGAKRYSAYRMTYRGEQVPNPNSRVTLTEKKDPLGVPTGQLHWDLEARDLEVVTQAVDVIGQEMGRRGIGRINAEPWRTGGSRKVVGGAHHVGTTRMSNDPRRGVIDRNCKVHDLENLYVSGSSVFTTSGSANPTLTIVALALRLAEHIEKVIT